MWLFGGKSKSELSMAKWPENLRAHASILDSKEVSFVGQLLAAGQAHLFEDWDTVGTYDDEKKVFLAQLQKLHDTYPLSGGLFTYLQRAKDLLRDSKKGVNPFDGWTPEVPLGVRLDPAEPSYFEYENEGLKDLGYCGFVLVAGGLGERLGYNGIKIGLPTETTTRMPYIGFYIKQILAIERRYAGPTRQLPLAIMVSEDTEAKTIELLESSNYFGMDPRMVTIMKQEKVAALTDNDARIHKKSKYEVDAKPHGHGDVHALMYSTGTASKWFRMGVKWVTFFQDTNGLSFKTLPAMVGVSKRLALEVNSLAVPRVAKQAVGAICCLRHDDGRLMTVNVEYNQLDAVLRTTINEDGDVNDPSSGLSPFPGNINQLIFKMGPYMRTLLSTSGVMGEFVNPKYADDEKTRFKKPTRLECMMQDYPKVLGSNAKVGFTMAPAWLCYSPCKNNASDAAEMARNGVPGGSAVSAEADQYNANAQMLRVLGCKVDRPPISHWLGIPAELGPAIVFDPTFAIFPGEIRDRVPRPHQVDISSTSTLMLTGNVQVESLQLDGALACRATSGSSIVVRVPSKRCVKNKGSRFVGQDWFCTRDEVTAMRGYRCEEYERASSTASGNQHLIFVGDESVTEAYYIKNIATKIYDEKELCDGACTVT